MELQRTWECKDCPTVCWAASSRSEARAERTIRSCGEQEDAAAAADPHLVSAGLWQPLWPRTDHHDHDGMGRERRDASATCRTGSKQRPRARALSMVSKGAPLQVKGATTGRPGRRADCGAFTHPAVTRPGGSVPVQQVVRWRILEVGSREKR